MRRVGPPRRVRFRLGLPLRWCLLLLGAAGIVPFPARALAQPFDPASFGFVVEAIEVLPPSIETDVLVRRNLGFEVGDRVPSSTLIESKARLEATGTFREVDVHTRRGLAPGAVVVVVEVEIGRRIHFEAGIGQEDFNGWYLNLLGLRWTSPLRRGGTARIGFHSGLEMSGLFAVLEVPEVPKRELDGLVDLAGFERTWVAHDGQDEYRQILTEARYLVGARRRGRDGLSATFWMGSTSVEPADSAETERGDRLVNVPTAGILPSPERSRFLEVRQLLERDRRGPIDPWRQGSFSGVQLRLADVIDGGGFWSIEGDTRVFLPLLDRSALAFRLRGAYTSPGTPYHQRFRFGGARSLRGYSSARLSGPLGAQAIWVGSAEWRHPLLGIDRPQPRVLGTVFVDVGNHWDSRGRHRALSAGVGYGIQIQIPWVQVMTWEVSYPIKNEPSVDAVVATLSLGRSF